MDDQDDLTARYLASIDDKLKELQRLISQYFIAPSEDTLKPLQGAVHKIAGSAGTYGFEAVTDLCRALEQRFIEDREVFLSLDEETQRDISTFYDQVERGFNKSAPSEKKKSDSEEEGSLDETLVTLSKEYAEGIDERLSSLKQMTSEALADPSEAHTLLLRNEIHNLSVSAALYGYIEVSSACDEAEEMINKAKEDLSQGSVSEEQKKCLEALPDRLLSHFKDPDKGQIQGEKSLDLVDLFVADEDQEFTQLVEKEGDMWGLKVKGASDPQHVMQLLDTSSFRPHIFLVSDTLLEALRDNNIIDLHRKKMGSSAVIGLLASDLTIEKRMEFAKKNVAHILEKPVAIEKIFDLVRSHVEFDMGRPFKVMVLDDDPDICLFIQSALEEINVNVKSLQDPKELFRFLGSYDPDLLLLDLNLPDHDGIELLNAIRSDINYRELPIIIITVRHDKDSIGKAYLAGVDDFITKPIDKTLFQARLTSERRTRSLVTLVQERDPLTGLYSNRSFFYLFRQHLRRESASGISHAIAFIGIDDFENLSAKVSEHLIHQLIVITANTIKRIFWSLPVVGYMGRGVFAIFSKGTGKSRRKTR